MSCHQKATGYSLYYQEPIQIKGTAHKNNAHQMWRVCKWRKSDLFLSVQFSSNEILIPPLWLQARLANTQDLNLIKPFTVCKAANNMLGKQSRCIWMLISLQRALCDTYNWAVATAAKLFQVNRAYKFTEIRTTHTSSKLSLLLGKY